MDDSLRLELYEFLRESLSIEVTMDTEYECESEYVTCSAELRMRHPETGEWIVIGQSYDSAYVCRD